MHFVNYQVHQIGYLLNMNNTYNTTNNGIKYNFKLNPLKTDEICNQYIYYKANFQYIMKTQNNPFILDRFNVKIYDGTFKPLNNQFIEEYIFNIVGIIIY